MLPCPWDSPGKNTEGLIWMKVKACSVNLLSWSSALTVLSCSSGQEKEQGSDVPDWTPGSSFRSSETLHQLLNVSEFQFLNLSNSVNKSLLLLLLLSCFSRVWLCVTPKMAATKLPHPWDSPGKNTGVGCHFLLQCMKVKSGSEAAQSCLTLSDPIDCSPPGSSVHGIFQARVLEWGAIAFSE